MRSGGTFVKVPSSCEFRGGLGDKTGSVRSGGTYLIEPSIGEFQGGLRDQTGSVPSSAACSEGDGETGLDQ